jgi:hypothetical protein
MSSFLFAAAFSMIAVGDAGPYLDGAFIQFDNDNKAWTAQKWNDTLKKMKDARLNIVIIQYLEARQNDQTPTSESYIPHVQGHPDPVKHILQFASTNNMKVFIGLRFDTRLMSSGFLDDPGGLENALKDELKRNIDLAALAARSYDLASLAKAGTFAGWYFPVEVANFPEKADFAGTEKGWISQMSNFARNLSGSCKGMVDRPVATSPYFNARLADMSIPIFERVGDKFVIRNGQLPGYLVGPDEMGANYSRFLKGSGISIVMLQDGVAARNIPTDKVQGWVEPYLERIEQACRSASTPDHEIEFWVNVESMGADIGKLKKQIEVAKGGASTKRTVVSFEFAHHLGLSPLYDDYLNLIK